VKVEIFNLLGQKVRTLVDEPLRAGHKLVDWDGCDDGGEEVCSGIYFYRIRASEFSDSKKMILLR
jgi:flagellar hook assembly protein FlgD